MDDNIRSEYYAILVATGPLLNRFQESFDRITELLHQKLVSEIIENAAIFNESVDLPKKDEFESELLFGGISLKKRLRKLAKQLSAQASLRLRKVPEKEKLEELRKVLAEKEYKIELISLTEVLTRKRRNFISLARKAGDKFIQFNEYFPASRNRERHACYRFAREDPEGLGLGVFSIEDEKIYNPHPRCTSYLTRWRGSDAFV